MFAFANAAPVEMELLLLAKSLPPVTGTEAGIAVSVINTLLERKSMNSTAPGVALPELGWITPCPTVRLPPVPVVSSDMPLLGPSENKRLLVCAREVLAKLTTTSTISPTPRKPSFVPTIGFLPKVASVAYLLFRQI